MSGLALYLSLLVLGAYALRRLLPRLAALPASRWLRLHLAVGVIGVPLFFVHTRGRIPNGRLEVTIAVLYGIVVLSGIAGIALWRLAAARAWDASRIAAGEDAVPGVPLAERRRDLARRAARLALESAESLGTLALAQHYERRLRPFFDRPRGLVAHLLALPLPAAPLLAELGELGGELPAEAEPKGRELAELVKQAERLDAALAARIASDGWLYIHVPASYLLLLLAALHGLVARAYLGGAP